MASTSKRRHVREVDILEILHGNDDSDYCEESNEESGSETDIENDEYQEALSEQSSEDESATDTARAEHPQGLGERPRKRQRLVQGEGRNWVNDSNFVANRFDFDNNLSGIQGNLNEESSELELFFSLFDYSLFTTMSEQTNTYFMQVKDKPGVSQQEMKSWTNTDEKELIVFTAITMLMGHVKKNLISEYWSTNPLISTPIFSNVMSRNRYQILLRMLHFSDNNTITPGDRLYKIRPILEALMKKFSERYVPFEKLAIDETLFLFKGRLVFRQYIPSKRARFGIKLFVIADCETGFVLHVIPYVGGSTELKFEDKQASIGITGRVVMTLMEPHLEKCHKLFIDNWYMSPALSELLYEKRTNVCGTVRKNRKGLPKPATTKMKKGETKVYHTNDLLYVRWCDKREVNMLSTMHSHEMQPTGKTDRQGDPILKPNSVLEYNENMGAVDIADMQMSFTESARKTVKWYKKLFTHLLDLTVRNACVMQNMLQGTNISLREFRMKLIQQMLEKYASEKPRRPKGGRPSSAPPPLRLTQRHFLSPIPATPSKMNPTRVCTVCSNTNRREKKRRESRYFCVQCDVTLCVHPCMEEYHTLLHF